MSPLPKKTPGIPIPGKPDPVEFEIEKDIPVPTRGDGHDTAFSEAVQLMDVGDSFFTKSPLKIVRSRTWYYSKKFKQRYTCREVEGGTRVWRIADSTKEDEAE